MTAQEIISKRIHELDGIMDTIVEYQLYMADNDCQMSAKEAKDLDNRWTDLFNRKCELMGILAEIQEVSIDDLVLY